MTRVSVSADAYIESHLISPTAGWPRIAYLFLALFAGAMAFMIFLSKDTIIAIPVLGYPGYLLFQLMTAGIFILGLNAFLWGGSTQQDPGLTASFSWWGFFVRDLFMGMVFAPFAIVIARIMTSGDVKTTGVFADLGGWEAFLNPETPLWSRIILGGICLILLGVLLILFFIPIFMLYRALLNLMVMIRRGNTKVIFSKESYSPGESLDFKILVDRPGERTEKRRVFLNFLQANPGEYPPSSKKYKRSYLYTEFYDFSVAELQAGITLQIPASIADLSLKSDHNGKDKIRYWEILMEEPEKLHWARFFVWVK